MLNQLILIADNLSVFVDSGILAVQGKVYLKTKHVSTDEGMRKLYN